MMEHISTPICDFLRDYAESGTSRFHMPGHKGTEPEETISDHLNYSSDITEIRGADSLYEADGIIRESEKNASALFGSEATFYSTEGSSQCIRAMLALAAHFSEAGARHERPVILAARNVHRSFITACALLDLDVEWIFPENGEFSLYSCPVTADQVRKALSGMRKKPAAVYVTTPDYLGNLQDIRSISQAAHEFGIPLLADNAHGAYLHFLDRPAHPLDLGADLCCDSAHKTLPALTGCAYLHLGKSARDFLPDARRALSMFGSTSPSYLLLSSLDRTNKVLAGSWRNDLHHCVRTVSELKRRLCGAGWKISGQNDSLNSAFGSEPLKITIHTSLSGYCGHEISEELRRNQIEPELSDPDFVVLMASAYNTAQDFDRLLRVMSCIPVKEPLKNRLPAVSSAEKVLSIREAMFSQAQLVPIEQAAGSICADTAVACPPALPVVVCGEKISETHMEIMKYYGMHSILVCKKTLIPQ